MQRLKGCSSSASVVQFYMFSCFRCYSRVMSKWTKHVQIKHGRKLSHARPFSSVEGQGKMYSVEGQGKMYSVEGQGKMYSVEGQGKMYSVEGQGKMYSLRSRGLIQLCGVDVFPFLQGLVTSDVTLLEGQVKSQCSFMLNVQGRVMYDMILYNIGDTKDEPCLLIECEASAVPNLLSVIKKYKIRKKVQIEDMSEKLQVLAGFPQASVSTKAVFGNSVVIETRDPRVPQFGVRVVENVNQGPTIQAEKSEDGYHQRRYEWGIPEGSRDLPTGNCFPLESNLVLMNGVSFDKGCYLGQELTARTHHTGVTRKRIMPLLLNKDCGTSIIEPDTAVRNLKGKSVGKLRSYNGQYGLGLMRVAEAKGPLSVGTKSGMLLDVSVVTPAWWPENVK